MPSNWNGKPVLLAPDDRWGFTTVPPGIDSPKGAEDVDFDADQGAMLVIPTAVLACHEVDRRLVAELERRTAEHAPD